MGVSSSAYRQWTVFSAVVLLGLPGIVLFLSGLEPHPLVSTCVYGGAILAGAFVLSWAAEVAELDISASLAIAILALLTVLPEYAIEAVLAWDAGASFDTATRVATEETRRVAANVTGANRLLIGFGWPVVILIFWLRRRQVLDLRGRLGPEVTFLAVATLLTFAIFFLDGIHLLMGAVLIGLYVAYLWVGSRSGGEEPELAGIAAWLGSLPVQWRRTAVALLFVYATAVIVVAADPFVESLIETGRHLGIDEFVLIQWIAPLASELPEVVVAVLFALRANAAAGITVLIASEVNKFTLLIGSMVVIFSLSAGEMLTFPLDTRQAVEFLLTAAVALFGLVLIARRTLDWRAGVVLLALFVAHLFFPGAEQRVWFTYAYLGLTGALIALDWRRVTFLFRAGD